MFQTKVVVKVEIHFCVKFHTPIHHPLPNGAVYEIMWKTLVAPDRPQMTI